MARDWALVGVLLVLVVVELALRDPIPYRTLSVVAALAGIPTLLIRRTRPLLAVAITFGVVILIDIPWLIGGGDAPGLYTSAFVLILPYALFRWASGAHALSGLAIMSVPAGIGSIFDFTALSETITGLLIFVSAMALGVAMRYRTRARTAKLDETRARERERLARDLHDTVAHHVSAIAIRAQAGIAVAKTDPNAALDALRVIETEASRTLAEMRTIVRTLRNDDAVELAPQPGIAAVQALATATPGDGPPVHVQVSGDVDRVPSSIATAAYRLAQESVTNARRHARRATRIDVMVRTTPETVTVEVTDDGQSAPVRGEGYGITGMIERAEQLGGTCTAGPREGRGWTVSAVLPTHGVSA